METPENLDEEEAKLLARLAEVKRQKEEIKRRLELEKAITVTASITEDRLYIRLSSYREDVVEYLKTVTGRIYSYANQLNSFPLTEWNNIKTSLSGFKNVTLEHSPEMEKRIHKILFAPNFEITLAPRNLVVVANGKAHTWGLRDIPGTDFDHRVSGYLVPLPEGWRLWNYMSNLDSSQTVIWSQEASEFVAKQVETRMMLDRIALAKDWDINVPGLKIKLKPFQNVGTAFFGLNGGSGILGDEMGLGKSAQAIAHALIRGGKVLLVVPAALKINWIREIRKFTDEQSYTLTGTVPQMYDIATMMGRDCPKFIIINYDILGSNTVIDESYVDDAGVKHIKKSLKYPWVEILNMVGFDLVVYDEGHYIKNVDSNRSKASRLLKSHNTIFLTGTPVLNRPGELWPMLNIIQPEMFPSLEKFKQQYTVDGKVTRNLEELQDVLKPIMIRRLKKDVYDELPPLNRINEYHELSPRAKKLYQKALDGLYEVVATWNPNEAGHEKEINSILTKIMRLKQIAAIDKVPATADLATRIFDSSDPSERPKKVLIFSQFKPTAYAIKVRLGSEAIGFVSRTPAGEFITAKASEQDELVQEFQRNPDIHYLIVTEKTAKEGHNITEAMAVIFNDLFWTPANHQQSEGRAYMRNNDPHGIDSYYHIAEDTIDEWIMELLAAKLEMIEATVDGVQSARVNADESIVKELIQKIKEGQWKR